MADNENAVEKRLSITKIYLKDCLLYTSDAADDDYTV